MVWALAAWPGAANAKWHEASSANFVVYADAGGDPEPEALLAMLRDAQDAAHAEEAY